MHYEYLASGRSILHPSHGLIEATALTVIAVATTVRRARMAVMGSQD
jgi:hypothetical protein